MHGRILCKGIICADHLHHCLLPACMRLTGPHHSRCTCTVPEHYAKDDAVLRIPKCSGCRESRSSSDSLDDTVIGEGACWQLLCGQDLDEGSRGLSDLLYDASSPAAIMLMSTLMPFCAQHASVCCDPTLLRMESTSTAGGCGQLLPCISCSMQARSMYSGLCDIRCIQHHE